MQLDSRDLEKIKAWSEEFHAEVTLKLLITDHEKSKDFEQFCRVLSDLIPYILFATEKGDSDQVPAITLATGWRYRAIPQGSELDPFLELLAAQANRTLALPETVRGALEKVEWPANLTVYVAPTCPFCPEVVRQIQCLPMGNEKIHLDIVDATLFPEMAQHDKVRSVPTVVLDDQFRWSGSIVLQELVDALLHRDPDKLSTQELLSIIKDGNADHLARMMLQKEVIFSGFLELLRHPNWSERLGAMVVLEQIAEENPQLAQKACPHLLHYLETAEDPVKGDLIYLLGLAGCTEAVTRLEGLSMVEESAENLEVLHEAIQKLKR